jgi:hypothetical protein
MPNNLFEIQIGLYAMSGNPITGVRTLLWSEDAGVLYEEY